MCNSTKAGATCNAAPGGSRSRITRPGRTAGTRNGAADQFASRIACGEFDFDVESAAQIRATPADQRGQSLDSMGKLERDEWIGPTTPAAQRDQFDLRVAPYQWRAFDQRGKSHRPLEWNES